MDRHPVEQQSERVDQAINQEDFDTLNRQLVRTRFVAPSGALSGTGVR